METTLNRMLAQLKSLGREEEGVTAIEYGLIAALIGVVIIIAVALVGTRLTSTFNKVSDVLPQ